MAKKKKIRTYPVGSVVEIRRWLRKPENWNMDMYNKLRGETAKVIHVHPEGDDTVYRYNLDRWQWEWRHCDLILISLAEPEPNAAFRMKKHGN